MELWWCRLLANNNSPKLYRWYELDTCHETRHKNVRLGTRELANKANIDVDSCVHYQWAELICQGEVHDAICALQLNIVKILSSVTLHRRTGEKGIFGSKSMHLKKLCMKLWAIMFPLTPLRSFSIAKLDFRGRLLSGSQVSCLSL